VRAIRERGDERQHGARAALDKHDLHVESLGLEKSRVLGDPQRVVELPIVTD